MSLKGKSLLVGSSQEPYGFILDASGIVNTPFKNYIKGGSYACAISPDGSMMAFTSGAIKYMEVFNTSDYSQVSGQPNMWTAPYGLAFSPDSTKIAVAGLTTPYIKVYTLSGWVLEPQPATLPTGSPPQNNQPVVAWSPDGTKLAIAHGTSPYITIYNTSDWSKIANPATLPTGSGKCVAWSPDGSMLAVGHGISPYITIYNTSDWSKIANPAVLPSYDVSGLAWSPDGSMLAATWPNVEPNRMLIYKVSNWSTLTIEAIVDAYSNTLGKVVSWLSNTELVLGTSGTPSLVIYDVDLANMTATISGDIRLFKPVYSIAPILATKYKIDGTIEESLAADTFIASAYDFQTKDYINSVIFTGTAYTLPVFNDRPVELTISALQGDVWVKSTVYALDAKVFPTNPINTPFYYICTTAGTSSASEPVWPITAGATVADGTVVWTRVENLIQSVTIGPLIPQPV